MKNLKDLRENYNIQLPDKSEEITQDMIADKFGITKSTISRFENGETNVHAPELLYYSRLLGVSIEYLLDDNLKAKQPKNMRVGTDLGVTDAVADTMSLVNDISKSSKYIIDLTAVLHAFIGNGENTVALLQTIFHYLAAEQQLGTNTNNDALIISNLMRYIDVVVKPQLQEVLSKYNEEQEMIANIPDEIKYS